MSPVWNFAILAETNGFLGQDWRDVLAVASLVVTALGLALVMFQVRGARTSAKAAESAAAATRDAVSRNLELADLNSAVRLTGEVGILIDSNQLSGAGLRLSDLRQIVVQIRGVAIRDPEVDRQFQAAVADVSIIEDAIKRSRVPGARPLQPAILHKRLRGVSDFLNGLASKARLRSGGTDGNS